MQSNRDKAASFKPTTSLRCTHAHLHAILSDLPDPICTRNNAIRPIVISCGFGFDPSDKEIDEVGFLRGRGDGNGMLGEDSAKLGDLRL
jgi:hypothetical protein